MRIHDYPGNPFFCIRVVDVLEVPGEQEIHALYGGYGYMQRIFHGCFGNGLFSD